MPVGKNDVSIHVGTRKAPEVRTPGLFYSVQAGWLIPQAGYLYLSLSNHLQMQQATTLAKIESKNDVNNSMLDSPPLCTCLGAVAQPLYHNLFCKTFLFYFSKIEFEFTFLVPDSEMSNHSSSARAFFVLRCF